MKTLIKSVLFSSSLLVAEFSSATQYFSWIDQNGQLRNSFLKEEAVSQADVDSYKALSLSDFVSEDNRIASVGLQINPKAAKEQKRKYYTWVEADGRTHNTEYAQGGPQIEKKDLVLQGGELASDYMDADELARRGFVRDGEETPYYTWVDPTGRLVTSTYQPGAVGATGQGSVIQYTEGSQFVFNQPQGVGVASESNQVMSSLSVDPLDESGQLVVSEPKALLTVDEKLMNRLKETCCSQMAEDAFYPLKLDSPIYEKLAELSPSYNFPTGHSYYVPVRLPISQQSYGLKIKSFAKKGLFYPVLLFLDENREPTRYVSDSVVEYHPETWNRYAHLEGRIQIKPAFGERYLLVFTTEDSLEQITSKKIDSDDKNKLASLVEHEHSKTGSVEIKVIY